MRTRKEAQMNEDKKIKEIEKRIGYTFRDKSLLLQAFTRTSFCNEHKKNGVSEYQSSEVLEFFGDSILSSAIVTLFIGKYTNRYEHGIRTALEEGDFTVIRSRLSDKKNLSDRAARLGLGEFLRMGEGDVKLGVASEPSVLEDLFESIIGAVYIDSGLDLGAVIGVVSGMLDIKKVIESSQRESAPDTMKSAKNRLQEWCADRSHRLGAPVYKTVGESGPEHKKVYERAVIIDGRTYATGSGKNLKAADAAAAEATLKILENGEGRVKKTAKTAPAAPTKKREEAPKVQAKKGRESASDGAAVRLKEYAKREKLLQPTFRDLGATLCDGTAEYRVRCTLAGVDEIGVGQDKSTARECAAARVLSRLDASRKKTEKRVKTSINAKKSRQKSNKPTIRKGTK